jgi:hypothetical protein
MTSASARYNQIAWKKSPSLRPGLTGGAGSRAPRQYRFTSSRDASEAREFRSASRRCR